MQTNHMFSTHKIIIFVVFISAAIMTSLFVFHLSHQAKPALLAAEDGMIFPVARDIKSFELVSTTNEKFTQKNFFNHWTLLFFGFTHCTSVCPTALTKLHYVYKELQAAYPNMQVVLVSLDPERDTPATLAQYTQSFNPNFIGVTGKIQDIHKLQSQLGIFSARDPNSASNNYQIQHTPSIMLIDTRGQWAGVFNFAMNAKQLTRAFDNSVKFLSRNKNL